jgi:hypothetical protein
MAAENDDDHDHDEADEDVDVEALDTNSRGESAGWTDLGQC